MLINLQHKPAWLRELSPTEQVPIAKIKDQLVHESYDILQVFRIQLPFIVYSCTRVLFTSAAMKHMILAASFTT